MSLKPGIGALWFSTYQSDVYPADEVIVRGKSCRPPRYYDKLLAKQDWTSYESKLYGLIEFSPQLEDIRELRAEKALLCLDDSTPERLAVREQVTLARINQFPRNKL